MNMILLLLIAVATVYVASALSPVSVPSTSPATGLPNQFYEWKEGQSIRYQRGGPVDGEPLLLVHGLFVNSDHWRKSLIELSEKGYQVYALDLFGCGYSDKPDRSSTVAQKVNAEYARFGNDPAVLQGVNLGTSSGGDCVRDVDLRQ